MRDVGGAFFEGLQTFQRSASFREDQHRDASLANNSSGFGHGLQRLARILSRDGKMARPLQVVAEKRHAEETLLCQEAKLDRNVAENDRRVHVAHVIGDKYIAAVRIDFLQAFDCRA